MATVVVTCGRDIQMTATFQEQVINDDVSVFDCQIYRSPSGYSCLIDVDILLDHELDDIMMLAPDRD